MPSVSLIGNPFTLLTYHLSLAPVGFIGSDLTGPTAILGFRRISNNLGAAGMTGNGPGLKVPHLMVPPVMASNAWGHP